MAALAYLLLPLSGVVAFFGSSNPRGRFHGAQAIFYGTLWALALWACSAVSPGATQICFVAGSVGWLALMLATSLGKDPQVPLVGRWLARSGGFSTQSED